MGKGKVLEFDAAGQNLGGARVGWLVEAASDGALVVDFAGNPAGPQPARSTVALDPDALAHAVASRQGVLVVLERGLPELPIIVGLIQPPQTLEAEVDRAETTALVDGKRVEIEGKDEIVLKCGKASITLRRNGRVVIRGTYVETKAAGTNRIKGGSVQIN